MALRRSGSPPRRGRKGESGEEAPPAPEGSARAGDPNFMMSLARGLAVIRCFGEPGARLSIAEVARAAGLPRAAARRCLYTLETLGYAGSDGRAYFLSPK